MDTKLLDYIAKGVDLRLKTARNKAEIRTRTIMVELIKAQRSEFLLLRDDSINDWWSKTVASVRKTVEAHEEEMRLYNIKLNAYNKLTEEERKFIKIREPKKPNDL